VVDASVVGGALDVGAGAIVAAGATGAVTTVGGGVVAPGAGATADATVVAEAVSRAASDDPRAGVADVDVVGADESIPVAADELASSESSALGDPGDGATTAREARANGASLSVVASSVVIT
jgi:hypothetical protein